MVVTLSKMKVNEKGIVNDIGDGCDARCRIQSMGIMIGKEIKKIAGHPNRGPQTSLVGRSKIAVGFGMSEKIFVEVERKS
ncbi:MAG: FeoA family protein [Candidatus Omnitrophota bacterium]